MGGDRPPRRAPAALPQAAQWRDVCTAGRHLAAPPLQGSHLATAPCPAAPRGPAGDRHGGPVARPSSPVSHCEHYCPWTSRATARHRTDGKRARASAPTDDPVLSRPARRNRLSLKTQDFRQQEAERPSSEPRTPLALLALPGEERPGATRRGAGDGDPGSGAGSTSGAETQTTDRQTCCLSHHSTSASLREVKWRDTLYMFQLCKGTLRAQVFAHPGDTGPWEVTQCGVNP